MISKTCFVQLIMFCFELNMKIVAQNCMDRENFGIFAPQNARISSLKFLIPPHTGFIFLWSPFRNLQKLNLNPPDLPNPRGTTRSIIWTLPYLASVSSKVISSWDPTFDNLGGTYNLPKLFSSTPRVYGPGLRQVAEEMDFLQRTRIKKNDWDRRVTNTVMAKVKGQSKGKKLLKNGVHRRECDAEGNQLNCCLFQFVKDLGCFLKISEFIRLMRLICIVLVYFHAFFDL